MVLKTETMEDIIENNRTALVKLYLEKGRETLHDADIFITSGSLNAAVNRVFYSVLQSVSALLVRDGYRIKKHLDISKTLYTQYVLTGKIDKDFSLFFTQLEKMKINVDYVPTFQVTKEEIMEFRPKADAFIATIKNLIGI